MLVILYKSRCVLPAYFLCTGLVKRLAVGNMFVCRIQVSLLPMALGRKTNSLFMWLVIYIVVYIVWNLYMKKKKRYSGVFGFSSILVSLVNLIGKQHSVLYTSNRALRSTFKCKPGALSSKAVKPKANKIARQMPWTKLFNMQMSTQPKGTVEGNQPPRLSFCRW